MRLPEPAIRNRHLIQLVTLLTLFTVYPLVQDRAVGSLVLDVMYTVILIAAVGSLSTRPRYFKPAVALAVAALLTIWTSVYISSSYQWTASTLIAVFFAYVIVASFANLLRGREVTGETVFQALNIYLFIGMFFAAIFSVVELTVPGSLSIPETAAFGASRDGFVVTFYYSFVNLTTVGFGDITPNTPLARALSIVEAIIGQFYLTVLVARLVGLHIAQTPLNPPTDAP